MEKILMTAERRGRELARLAARRGGSLHIDAVDDRDGPGMIAAARWAARLGIACRLRVGRRVASPVWQLVVDSSLRQGLVDTSASATASQARLLRGGEEEDLPLPCGDTAWAVPLRDAEPFVLPADAASPVLPPALCRDIDRRAIERYGIPGVCLMENAAVAAVIACRPMVPHDRAGRITILAGGGNNGGDGLAMARGFAALGIASEVALVKPSDSLSGDAAANLAILAEKGKVPLRQVHNDANGLRRMVEESVMVVDALLGTGFHGTPSREFTLAIEAVNGGGRPVVAVDLPSGLDGETGEVAGPAIRATRTVTFAAVKTGLLRGCGPDLSGELFLGDIGVPQAAFPPRSREA